MNALSSKNFRSPSTLMAVASNLVLLLFAESCSAATTPFVRTGVYYPEALEDSRMICPAADDMRFLPVEVCKNVAQDFYREIYYQVHNFTPTGAFDVIRQTSIEEAIDGSGYTKGLAEAVPLYTGLTAGNYNTLSIENAFAYQPLDLDTVVFFGAPLFTDYSTNVDQKAYVHNVQMSVYRRIQGSLYDPS